MLTPRVLVSSLIMAQRDISIDSHWSCMHMGS